MPTPFESAQLNLKLYELRRESVLREARQWFVFEYHPESFEDLTKLSCTERKAFRMVLSYWEMAASLVTSGAIDADSFFSANEEVIVTFSKVHPLLEGIRAALQEPKFLKHLADVVLALPQAAEVLARRRGMVRGMNQPRATK